MILHWAVIKAGFYFHLHEEENTEDISLQSSWVFESITSWHFTQALI